MVRSITANDFLNEATEKGIIIDVRTPAEYGKGHILGAINIPVLTDEDRIIIGTLYVRVGREEAIEKGLELVGPRMADMVKKAKRVSQGRPLYLYCWRGGMRSGSMAWLLSTAGLTVSLLKGGYKAYRRSFEQIIAKDSWQFVLLSGLTGCGKTELLHRLSDMGEQVLDLEGLANHKGSAFGGIGQQEQPTTEHFINKLHHRFGELTDSRIVWCEAESLLIGSVFLPKRLYEIMHEGIDIKIETDIENRLDRLMNEYGSFSTEDLIGSFQKISKRLGPDQTKIAVEHIEKGEIRQAAAMGLKYYDKSYKKSSEDDKLLHFTVDNVDISAPKLKEFVYTLDIEALINKNKEDANN